MQRLLIIMSVVLLPALCHSAEYYIWNGATGAGTGADWTNAYTSFADAGLNGSSSTAPRGNTYYVAGSATEYGEVVWSNAASGTDVITVKKANAADNSGVAGWQASFATTVAEFKYDGSPDTGVWKMESPYWVFDGVTGGGPDSWRSGHGFLITADPARATIGQKNIKFNSSSATDITFSHIEMDYDGTITATDSDSFYVSSVLNANVTLEYSWVAKSGRVNVFTQSSSDFIFQYNCFEKNKEVTSQHSESFADTGTSDVIIRHNFFYDTKGTGLIVILNRSGVKTSDSWEIYGNVFLNGPTGYVSDGSIACINEMVCSNWKIYNNTFIEIDGNFGNTGITFSQAATSSSDNVAYNNLFYDSEDVTMNGDSLTHDYNYYVSNDSYPSETNEQTGTGDPFTDYASFDFSLTTASDDGYSLSSPYDVDMFDVTRGGDEVWDRGAVEYGTEAETEVSFDQTGTLNFNQTGTVNFH